MVNKLLLAAVSAASLLQGSYAFPICSDNSKYKSDAIAYGVCTEEEASKNECKTCSDMQMYIFDMAPDDPSFEACTTVNPTTGVSLLYMSTLLAQDCCPDPTGREPKTACDHYQGANKICQYSEDFLVEALLNPNGGADGGGECGSLNLLLPFSGLIEPNAAKDGYTDIDCSATVAAEFLSDPNFAGLPFKRAADFAGFFGKSCCKGPSVCEDDRSDTQFCTDKFSFKPDAVTTDPENQYEMTCMDVSHMLAFYIEQLGASAAMKGNILNAQDCLAAAKDPDPSSFFPSVMQKYTRDCCESASVYTNLCHELTNDSPCSQNSDCFDETFSCEMDDGSPVRRKLFYDDEAKEDPKKVYGMCKRLE